MSNLWLKKPGNVSQSDLRRMEEAKQARQLSPEVDSRLEEDSSLEESSSAATPSSPEPAPMEGPQTTSLEAATSPETTSDQPTTLAAYADTLSYGTGHLRLNNDYFDKVLTLLSDLEQLLFIHILRYREGKSDHTILLNFPLLEGRTHVSSRTLNKVAAALERRGMVVRYGHTFGRGGRQGFRFRIVMPSSLVSPSSPEATSSLATTSDNKRLKDQSKRKEKKDASTCPDCFGTGMYYPEGFANGVKRCTHSRLRE